MPRKKEKYQSNIKLRQSDLDKLSKLASEELIKSRLKFVEVYNSTLSKSNDPNKSLKEAESKSPISTSYNYHVMDSYEESGEKWNVISVNDDESLKKIQAVFRVDTEEKSESESDKESEPEAEEEQNN